MSSNMAASNKRKRPVREPYTGEFWKGDNLEWTRASVLDNGLIHPKTSGRVKLEKALPDPNVAADNLYALNTLQQREDTPVNDSVMQGSLQAMISYLPQEVSDQIYIGEQPGESTDFSTLVTDITFTKNLESRWPRNHPMFRNMKLCPFFFWPINTGKESSSNKDHYVTLIMWLRQNSDAVAERKKFEANPRHELSEIPAEPVPYDGVHQWSIVDPKRGLFDSKGHQTDGRDAHRSLARVQCVRKRVTAILDRGGIQWDFGSDYMVSKSVDPYAMPWVVPQRDDWSSGFRSFALIKKQCEIVLDYHCAEAEVEEDIFWQRSTGFLNPHQVRHEMMGLLAVNCIADMRWRARIAIEPVAGDLDGVMLKDKFPAKKLKPSGKPPTWYSQDDFDGPDLTDVTKGYKPS